MDKYLIGSTENKWTIATSNNMGEPYKYNAAAETPNTKEFML